MQKVLVDGQDLLCGPLHQDSGNKEVLGRQGERVLLTRVSRERTLLSKNNQYTLGSCGSPWLFSTHGLSFHPTVHTDITSSFLQCRESKS